jgi:LysM repeat protein/uncharacterized protein YvpB
MVHGNRRATRWNWFTATVLVVATVLSLATQTRIGLAKATHEAAPGQALADVATEHGVSVSALAALNELSPDTVFEEPTPLIVPGEGGNPPVPGDVAPEAYVVVEGDTIEAIAAQFGVSVAALIAVNHMEGPDDLLRVGQRLLIPLGGPAAASSSDPSGADAFVSGIPAYRQARSLSCEYASVYIATSAFGGPIYEEEYLATTPSAENPHLGYRGDIDGVWGRTDDYGIYAEALVPTLHANGYVGEVSYAVDANLLRSNIDAGRPVIVWIATRGDTGFYEVDDEGNSFKLVPWEHVVVVYGYDDVRVYISDPGPGAYDTMSWGSFLEAWAVLDGMALTIYPG